MIMMRSNTLITVVGLWGLQTASAQGPGLRGLEQEVIKPDVPVGEFRGRQMQSSDEWSLLLITDLDKNSKVGDDNTEWESILLEATLYRDTSSGMYSVDWGSNTTLYSGHGESGRGMELSALIEYDGTLLTMDDRTGIVFAIIENFDGSMNVAPRYIIGAGNATVDKGMKLEWAAEKDGSLYIGGPGYEYTDPDTGLVDNIYNNWVITIDEDGVLTRADWSDKYNVLRAAVNATTPGYVSHESAAWSYVLDKWVFLPRRIGTEAYSDEADEENGSNTIMMVDENFETVEVSHVGVLTPTRGFSAFKFVPGTYDEVIVALKSEEIAETDYQTTFITVFTLNGDVLLDEYEVPGNMKFEGIEIFGSEDDSECPDGSARGKKTGKCRSEKVGRWGKL